MRIELSAVSLQLPQGASLRLHGVRGLVVRGRAGRLWLTEEDSLQDVFLHAGDTYVVAGDGRVVIGAECDAALALQARDDRYRHGAGWRGLSERLSRLAARVHAGQPDSAVLLTAA